MEQIGPDTRGVYIISVTPFTDAGEIDWGSVDTLVEFYLGKGVSGVTILGMMGEAHKLTPEVRQYLEQERAAQPDLSPRQLAGRLRQRFGLKVHPRTIDKALKPKAKRGR